MGGGGGGGGPTGGRESRTAPGPAVACGATGRRRCGAAEVRRGEGAGREGRPAVPPASLPPFFPPRWALGSPAPFPGFIPESGKKRLDLQEWRRISWSPRRGRQLAAGDGGGEARRGYGAARAGPGWAPLPPPGGRAVSADV